MKRRITALLLICSFALSSQVSAVSSGNPNFARTKNYSGQFTDLSESSTFYPNVTALYEYGLSVGKLDGTFGLQDPVTVGQAVIFAARLRSLYEYGDAETGAALFYEDGQAAYLPYLMYLQSLGVLGNELDGTYGSFAARNVVAHILARALPQEALPAIHTDLITQARATGCFLTDISEKTLYFRDILQLYYCGISQGSDSEGSFYPDTTITRGALSAMLTRMVDPSLRVTPKWDIPAAYSAQGTRWSDLQPSELNYIQAPVSNEEITAAVQYMLAQESNKLSLRYSEITMVQARQIMMQALQAVKRYCEQCYNTTTCTFDPGTGSVELLFTTVSCTPEETADYREQTLLSAIAVHDQLWEAGAIAASMSEKEKARIYFDWVCRNSVYDHTAASDSLSHIAFSLFRDGLAVCDGYTGAYNLLLKLEGIECYALSNSEHIWTVALLDGKEYHIDTTWGDRSGAQPDLTFFAMSEATSRTFHPW